MEGTAESSRVQLLTPVLHMRPLAVSFSLAIAIATAMPIASQTQVPTWIAHDQGNQGQGGPPIGNLVFDSARHRFVYYSGNIDGTLWEWTGSDWTGFHWMQRRPLGGPSPRATKAVAYDSSRHRMVVFGGSGVSQQLQDTWEWDGTNWQEVTTATPPPAGYNYGMLYDTNRGRIVLGGVPYTGPSNGLWTYDGVDWTQISTTRSLDRVTFDPIRGRYVLVVNSTSGLSIRESVDGINYVPVPPPAGTPQPHNRQSFGMAVDAYYSGGLVVFGGDWAPQMGTTPPAMSILGDTWTWNGTVWTDRTGLGDPEGREYPLMCFGPGNGVLMCGGRPEYWSGTWTWSGISWTRRTDDTPTGETSRNALVFDAALTRPVRFSGASVGGPVAAIDWDGHEWSDFTGAGPGPRREFAVAYHAPSAHTLFFGGYDWANGTYMNDSWLWSSSGWVALGSTGPPARESHRMAYDSNRQEVVLFGGTDGTQILGDTWTWNGIQWQLRQPTVSPPARIHHAMCHDSARQRTVMFGGGLAVMPGLGDDTWEWDGMNWQLRNPVTRPPAQQLHAMAYDSVRQLTILVGDATWEWDGATWRRMTTSFTPPTNLSAYPPASMTYDTSRRAPMLYTDRTWILSGHLAAAHHYGVGCAGTTVMPELDADLPYLGNVGMELRLHTNQTVGCAFVLSTASDNASLGGGCSLLVQLPGFLFAFAVTDLAGLATLRLEIPTHPYFIGMAVYAQAAAGDPFNSPSGIVVTDGVQLTLGF